MGHQPEDRNPEARAKGQGAVAALLGSLGCLAFGALPLTIIGLVILFVIVMGIFRGCAQ